VLEEAKRIERGAVQNVWEDIGKERAVKMII
jgi:hypothetical protein